jgi:hypothetical protein
VRASLVYRKPALRPDFGRPKPLQTISSLQPNDFLVASRLGSYKIEVKYRMRLIQQLIAYLKKPHRLGTPVSGSVSEAYR